MTQSTTHTGIQDPGATAAQETPVPFPQARSCPYQPPAGYGPLRESYPIGRVTLYDGRAAWAVTGHALARDLLSDPRLSCDRTQPGFPAPSEQFAKVRARGVPLISVDDPAHNAQRRLLIPHFTLKQNASMRPRIQQIVDQLLDAMERQGPPAELVSAFALPMPSMVICSLLGVPYDDHEFFEAASERLLRGQTVEEVARARQELERYMGELVDRKRREPGDGLLDELMRMDTPNGPLGRQELVALSGMLLAAGHETTANMISLGVFTLLRHPEQLAALRSGRTPMAVVVEELLRYLSVQNGMLRVAVEDIEVAGRTIRAGEGVIIMTAITNRDGTVFAAPDSLDWDRSARHHLAFGFGVHQCLGQNLARLELEIALGCLFERLPGLRLAVAVEEVRSKPATSTIDGLLELPVAW
ncbi:cytochrome P450 [Streptomyces durhamensis]|uniref:cytochrome P450 n=1 Tax=Streptomyces durhamensis TaxID=68194 RepID=UPI0004CCB11A|nr:cytochrome P450 [Streptomyces durhamensis]